MAERCLDTHKEEAAARIAQAFNPCDGWFVYNLTRM